MVRIPPCKIYYNWKIDALLKHMKDVSHSMRLLVLLITIDGIAEGFKENHQEKICITYKAYIYMYLKLMQSVTMGWHMISISATNPHQELHQPWNINAACLFF